jgi:hypothetical protein
LADRRDRTRPCLSVLFGILATTLNLEKGQMRESRKDRLSRAPARSAAKNLNGPGMRDATCESECRTGFAAPVKIRETGIGK